MNRLFFVLYLALIVACGNHDQKGMRVASYNIRYAAEADDQSGNGWQVRKKPLAALIERHGFDIIGTQEGNARQLKELNALLSGYAYLGHPYGGLDGQLHNCATFYKSALFEVLDSGVFWLSETPDIPSIGWDASDRRICHWAKFREKTSSQTFFFFNVHFYWRKRIAKEQSSPLLVQKIREIAGRRPVICTGDFNSTAETTQIQAVKALLSDTHDVSKMPRMDGGGTGLPGGIFKGRPGKRIDYIFVSDDFVVEDYKVITDMYNHDRYPSDHLPVTSKIKLKQE